MRSAFQFLSDSGKKFPLAFNLLPGVMPVRCVIGSPRSFDDRGVTIALHRDENLPCGPWEMFLPWTSILSIVTAVPIDGSAYQYEDKAGWHFSPYIEDMEVQP